MAIFDGKGKPPNWNRGQQLVKNTGVQHRPDDISRVQRGMGLPQSQGTPTTSAELTDATGCCGYEQMIVWRGAVDTTPILLDWQSYGLSVKIRVTNFSVNNEVITQPSIGIAFGGVPASNPSLNPSVTGTDFITTCRIGGIEESASPVTWDYPHRDFEINVYRASIVCSDVGGVAEVCIFF